MLITSLAPPAWAAFALCAAMFWHASALAAASRDYFVPGLPGMLEAGPVMHAGNVVTDEATNSSLFFMHFEANYRVSPRPKLLIWLNGGPGCSSMDGAFIELGPMRVIGDELVASAAPWNEFVSLLFVDQPYGVGFSKTDGPLLSRLDEAAVEMHKFLDRYFDIFPEQRRADIYLAGESFAGQYIPYIYEEIKEAYRVEGVVLGNPWIDAAHQYLSYTNFLKQRGLLVDPQMTEDLEHLHELCQIELSKYETIPPTNKICERINDYVFQHLTKQDGMCINVYDIRLTDKFPACGLNWPAHIEDLKSYLSRDDVQEALHADKQTNWTECSNTVGEHFHSNDLATASTLLPGILERTPVLILIGDQDYLCNGLGLDNMVSQLSWNAPVTAHGFSENEPKRPLKYRGRNIGTLQQGRNLTVAHLANGTHMLPYDMQAESRKAMHAFLGLSSWDSDAVEKPVPDGSSADAGTPPSARPGPLAPDSERVPYSTYQKAGITALIVVAVAGLVILWVYRRNGTLSWSGLVSALLQRSFKRKQPPETVGLYDFRRRRVPRTIYEEEEDDV